MKTIAKLLLINVLILFVLCAFMKGTASAGEPIPGAEIYVELDPDDVPIANVSTNGNGEFIFTFPNGIKIPKNGVFSITIIPPKKLSHSQEKKWSGMKKQTIKVPFNKKDGPKFKYFLTWKVDSSSKAQSKGAFAVSGKSNI